MIKWNPRAFKIAVTLGALAAFVISAGAGTRWA